MVEKKKNWQFANKFGGPKLGWKPKGKDGLYSRKQYSR